MDKIVESFKKINSVSTLKTFITQFNLEETSRHNDDAKYGGVINGSRIVLEEHSWDPSQVFSLQKDQYSVSLLINDKKECVVRFTADV